ncbi:hypothetical protein CFC21_005094 [Triticum aestivum]|uniref:Uncharacterized protein n=2 Tax=Triticum aestivum TaxID=4565 RepID=A0A9R1D8X2_WHEAT|nr:hypothetical protein CFC21_005094 [Triticum aestivum]
MVTSMARGLTIVVFLLVFVAATISSTYAVKLQADDAPNEAEGPTDTSSEAEGPTDTSSEAEGPNGPAFVEMVIKNPYPASSLNSRSDGLPTDPTPDGLPVDPTPDGLLVDPTPDGQFK